MIEQSCSNCRHEFNAQDTEPCASCHNNSPSRWALRSDTGPDLLDLAKSIPSLSDADRISAMELLYELGQISGREARNG